MTFFLQEATLKLEQDHKIICDYREKTIFEGSHVMDTGVKPASATLDIDESQAALVIQSQKKNDMDKVSTAAESLSLPSYPNPDIWSIAATSNGGKAGSTHYT
jgi:hypothetical protein